MTGHDSPPIIVSNTTPISELAKIGQLELLRAPYQRVLIPEQAHQELATGPHPAKAIVPAASWIEVRQLQSTQIFVTLCADPCLDLGECAAIALAEELQADCLLVDDLAARRETQKRGLPIIGTLGILLGAKQQGLVPNLQDLLDDLFANGTWISRKLYREMLAAAGE
jgi:uncharacterized protein